jgi:hypothetical protein
MTLASRLWGVLVGVLLSLLASQARAVSCNVQGTVTIEPQDSFYCDTTVLGSAACSSWREVNLDTTTKPMRYMWITVVPHDGVEASTRTDANGNWSTTVWVNAAQCQGQAVDIQYKFARLWEFLGGFYNGPLSRFWIVDVDEANNMPGVNLHAKEVHQILSGPTHTRNQNWTRGSTDVTTRLANTYYILNSMITEVVTWSDNLHSRFLSDLMGEPVLKFGMELNVGGFGGLTRTPHDVLIGWPAYGAGGVVRHELGHVVHTYVHHEDRNWGCLSYGFSHSSCTGTDGCENKRSCEYGSTALSEGLANFFAVRSITTNDTQVWGCACFDGASGGSYWHICSDHALSTFDSDGDWFKDCSGGLGLDFSYIGDFRVSSPSTCVRLNKEGGCNCSPPMGSTACPLSFYSSTGWRNATQITRFLWDLIDQSTDDGGVDNENLGITDIVQALEAMPCVGNHGGEDGSCEEDFTTPCDPESEGPLPANPPSRDSYNVHDIEHALPNSQTAERALNCVQGAPD